MWARSLIKLCPLRLSWCFSYLEPSSQVCTIVRVLFLQGMLQWVRCRKDVRILSLWCEHDDSTLSKTWQCDCQLQGSLEVAHLLRGIRWNDQGNGMLLVL